MKSRVVSNEKSNYLRAMVFGMVIAGALSSLIKTIQAGRNNKSVLLITLFVIWVLSPFTILFIANLISKKWSFPAQRKLYLLSTFMVIVSLIAYSGLWTPPDTKNAFIYLIVPLLSWLLMIFVYLITKSKRTK